MFRAGTLLLVGWVQVRPVHMMLYCKLVYIPNYYDVTNKVVDAEGHFEPKSFGFFVVVNPASDVGL